MWGYFRNLVLLLVLQGADLAVCRDTAGAGQAVRTGDYQQSKQQVQNGHLSHEFEDAAAARSVLQTRAVPLAARASLSPKRSPSPKQSPRKKSPKPAKSPKKPPSPKVPKSPKRPPSPKKAPSPKTKPPSAKLPAITNRGNIISSDQTTQACWRKAPFFQGMNVAFNNRSEAIRDEPGQGWTYGSNFGYSSLYPKQLNYVRTFWADAFAELQQAKGTVARFWLLVDGRNTDMWRNGHDGNFPGFGAKFYQDLDDLFALAAARNIKLIPTLFSYVVMEDKTLSPYPWPAEAPFDRSFLVKNWTIAEAFMEKMFKPLVIRYNKHPGLFAWDCMNEPEQVTTPGPGTKPAHVALASIADWQHWVGMCTAVVHQNSVIPVTFGNWEVFYLCNNKAMGCLGNRWSDDNLRRQGLPHRTDLWKYTYLDFYQAHFYKKPSYPLPDAQYPQGKPACMWGIDKPLMIGESPNREKTWGPEYAPARLLEFACKNGYMGAMFWSMRVNQDDQTRNWNGFKPALTNFDVTTCTSKLAG